MAAASGRAWYRARCAHASAGTPAGRAPATVVPSGTSSKLALVTKARSAAGVISIDVPARADTCPYAVTSPSRASTFAASAISSRSSNDAGFTVEIPFPDHLARV